MTAPRKQLLRLVLLVACAIFAGGCDFHYQPLEVHWTVEGTKDPKVCKTHGIKSWIVEIIATDMHAWTEVRCEDQKWTSGEAFYSMEADEDGFLNPELLVDAVDDTLSVKASQSRKVSMEVNRAKLIMIADIDFRGEDFVK